MSAFIYLGIMLAVICLWFILLKRPVYEAVFVSFILLITITNKWSSLWGYIQSGLETSLLYSMVVFVAMSLLLSKTKIIDSTISIILALMGKISGGASNLSSGGIGVGFDFETGKFNDFGIRYKRFCEDGEWLCNEHPDTGVGWIDECLPNWKYVKNKVEHVCSHITSLDYLGFDIIITSTGLKFCEINTHPAADYEQVMCNPILQDEKNVDFFRSKGLFEIDTERFFELYAQSH